ncbi:MAG TPA: PAS domain-containing protein [Micromonospora sp.]
MAHVELSLSEAFVSRDQPPPEPDTFDAFDTFTRWSATVAGAAEPCLVIDAKTTITAISRSCCQLLGLGAPGEAVGRPLLDGGIRLLDFTAARGELTEQDVDKIPPLLALSSGRLARGLLRVGRPGLGEPTDATVDAIATPLLDQGHVAGSLTFLSEV